MSHIFISYSSKDRATTRKLANIFEKQKWKVWWDKNITPGKAFDRAISKALDDSFCIVVLWSPNSVESAWVMEEAYEALGRDILVPALINNVRLPFGYRRIQYIDLTKGDLKPTSTAVKKLIAAIEPFVPEKAPKGTKKPSTGKTTATTKKKTASKTKKYTRTFSGGLDGKRIVFTGKLSESRKAHSAKVKTVGALFSDSLSSKTDYLVVGKEPGAVKLEGAKKHGTKKITEKTWLKMLNETYRRTFINKQIVFTGKLAKPRKELEKLVKKLGAKSTQDISGKTDFLIVGEKPGKVKLAAAEKFSLQVIDEKLWEEIVETL